MSAHAASTGPANSRHSTHARFDYIDAMRGIAALLVIWAHVTETFVPLTNNGAWLNEIAARLELGRVGVVLFFAISGFVIPFSLRAKGAGGVGRATRVFFAHRFFRLFPAYWLSVAAAAVVAASTGTSMRWQEIVANLTMVQTGFGFADAIGLYWSLRVELVFYALCALLFMAGILQRPGWLAVGVLGGVTGFFGGHVMRHLISPDRWDPRLVQLPLYALFIAMMFWGALFRSAEERNEEVRCFARFVLIGFPVLIFVLPIGIGLLRLWRPVPMGQVIPHALGLGLFLLLAGPVRLHGATGAWLGRISYSLYLFHPIVFWLLLSAMIRGFFPQLASHLAWPLIVTMAVSIGLAGLVYHFVEAPAIALGRRLAG